MNTSAAVVSHGLMRLGEAWRNRSALITLLITLLGFVVLLALGGAIGQPMVFGLFLLLAWVWMLVGTAAAGRQYAQQAADEPVMSSVDALVSGPMIVLRLLGLGLLMLVPPIVWGLGAALLLVLCKVPGLGGILLIVVLPVLVFTAALMFLGLYIAAGLAFGALCAGHTLRQALTQLWAIATRRPVEAFLHLILLYFVTSIVGLLVMGIIGAGVGATMGVAAPILGGQAIAGFQSMMGGAGGGGMLAFGAGLGMGIVVAVGASLLLGILLLGLNLTYRKVAEGLDLGEAQASMAAALEATKRKAQQAAEEARRRTAQVQAAAQARMATRDHAATADAPAPAQAPVAQGSGVPAGAPAASAARAPSAAPMPPAAPVPPPAPVQPAAQPPARPPVALPPDDDERTVIRSPGTRAPSAATPPSAAPARPAAPACPACGTAVAADDLFCGSCGHKLK